MGDRYEGGRRSGATEFWSAQQLLYFERPQRASELSLNAYLYHELVSFLQADMIDGLEGMVGTREEGRRRKNLLGVKEALKEFCP